MARKTMRNGFFLKLARTPHAPKTGYANGTKYCAQIGQLRYRVPGMTFPRGVYVFYRSDGKCIHHGPWDVPHSSQPLQNIASVPPSTLFPLIQVFIQFSREVQGNSVKRLVFRTTSDLMPPPQRFHSRPQRSGSSKQPFIIHVAHDDIFVVALTDSTVANSYATKISMNPSEELSEFTVNDFCESVLDFLNKEQSSFLASLAGTDNSPAEPSQPRHLRQRSDGDTLTSQGGLPPALKFTNSQSTTTSNTLETQSDAPDRQMPQPTAAPAKPVVSIYESRLTEYIVKTQTLLRM